MNLIALSHLEHREAMEKDATAPVMVALLLVGCTGELTFERAHSEEDEPASVDASSDPTSILVDEVSDVGDAQDPFERYQCADAPTSVGEAPLRRLTSTAYTNIVHDVFALDFSPELVADEEDAGFAINSNAPVSTLQVDQYARAAQQVAAQAVEKSYDDWFSCDPTQLDCVEAFVDRFGEQLHRRPLREGQRSVYLGLFENTRASFGPRDAAALVLEAMLGSPDFLYHVEVAATEGALGTDVSVDSFTLAARLSFFLWDAGPDEILLDLASDGSLLDSVVLEAQVERMLDSSKAARGLTSFYTQWLGIGELDEAFKSQARYPEWNKSLSRVAEEAVARFAVDVTQHGTGFAELMTAKWAYANTELAPLYGSEAGEELERIEMTAPDRAGVMSQVGFLASHAHSTIPSVVERGLFVRERLLCQPLPELPEYINFGEVVNPGRLSDPQCSGCHQLLDPIGAIFDQYGAIGESDPTSADAPGEVIAALDEQIDGVYQDPAELAQSLSASALVKECFSTQWLRYALARRIGAADRCTAYEIAKEGSTAAGDIRSMLRAIALHPAFSTMKAGPG